MNRSDLATAQVLPALSRATMMSTPDVVVSESDYSKAARLARASLPMYEGTYTYAQLYVGNLGIITAKVMTPGEE
jgi:hypothetical protein